MLGYICKYAPVEVFEAMGETVQRIEPQVTNFNQADMKMHPNICSFAKGVLEEVSKGEYDGIILTTCCDSIRRLYDVLKEEMQEKFIYIPSLEDTELILHHSMSECSVWQEEV